jgi:hypothetical protein
MGQELRVVFDAMGQWGAKWLEIEPRHLDAGYVLWATSKLVDPDRIPWVPLFYGSISPTPQLDTGSSCGDRNRSCARDRAVMSRTWSVQLAPAALSICIFAVQHIRAPCATAAWR